MYVYACIYMHVCEHPHVVARGEVVDHGGRPGGVVVRALRPRYTDVSSWLSWTMRPAVWLPESVVRDAVNTYTPPSGARNLPVAWSYPPPTLSMASSNRIGEFCVEWCSTLAVKATTGGPLVRVSVQIQEHVM
jgi:hypothetical protein